MKKYWVLRFNELHLINQVVDTYIIPAKADIGYKEWLLNYLKYNFGRSNVKVLLTYDDGEFSKTSQGWCLFIVNYENNDNLGKYMGTVGGLIRYNKLKKIYEDI